MVKALLYHHFLIPMENQCSIKKICNQWCYEILFSYRFLILYSANYTFSICRNFEKRLSEISGEIIDFEIPLQIPHPRFSIIFRREISHFRSHHPTEKERLGKNRTSLHFCKKIIVHKNFFRYLWPVVVFHFAKFTHKKYQIWMICL